MDDDFKRGIGLDNIFESAFNSDIFNDNIIQLAFLGLGERLLESSALVFAAYTCNYGMALVQQLMKNVYCNEASTA